MNRDELIARLKQIEPALRAQGASALYLYGSHARNEAGSLSDVDVFIDVNRANKFGFDQFMTIYAVLRNALGTEVDYTTREGLVKFFRSEIEKDAVRIF